jgi:hypothetical protein
LNDWDPIDIQDVPEAQDEYDRYIAPVIERLRSGASAALLARWLLDIETGEMGLAGDVTRAHVVASKLLTLSETS